MGKLTKMEVAAIASKICEDANKVIRKKNNELTSEEEFNKWFKTFKTSSKYKSTVNLDKAVKSFNSEFESEKKKFGYNYWRKEILPESFYRDLFENQIKKQFLSKQADIERDIIISQAKNEDIDVLIKTLTEKYSN